MKAILLSQTGAPDVLKVSEIPDPQPGPGQVLVKLEYTGLNYAEILSRKGLYAWAPKRPYILGMEGAGIIQAVGPEVDATRVGEQVMVGAQNGCYADMIVVPTERALPVLHHLSLEESAAFGVNYATAWVALFRLGRLQPHEKVLITAAAGGVGTAAVQLASKFGCEVYGMAGNDQKLKLIKELGANHAFNYRQPNYFAELQKTAGGIDVVLETVGGEVYEQSIRLLNPFGRMVIAGFASMDLKKLNPLSWWKTWRDAPKAKLMKMAEASIGVMATHLGYLLKHEKLMQEIFVELSDFVSRHQIKPVVGRVFPFEEAAEAHAYIESRQSVGKILLKHG